MRRRYGPLSVYTRALVRNRASAPNHASYAEVASLRPVIEDYSKTLLGLFAAGEYNYISHLANCAVPAQYNSVNWVAKLKKDPWSENLREK